MKEEKTRGKNTDIRQKVQRRKSTLMNAEEWKKGEYETVEYKVDIPEDKGKYLKTVVVFANGAGGKLIFGVKDNTWEVVGFTDEDVFEKMDTITNSIYGSCVPKIIPDAKIQDIDGKHIIVVTIHSGPNKPYSLGSLGVTEGTFLEFRCHEKGGSWNNSRVALWGIKQKLRTDPNRWSSFRESDRSLV